MKRSFYWISALLIIWFATPIFAQLKIGYVNTQRVLQEYEEAVDVQNKLEEIRNQYQAEYDRMVKEYNDLVNEIESQSLLLSEEKRQEKMRQAQEKALQIERYKYEKLGPEGEFYRKNLELNQPIVDKINKAIQKLGEEGNYDYILDVSSGVVLYAPPKYDLTDQLLEELNKGVVSKKK